MEINVNTKISLKKFIWFGISYRDALEREGFQSHTIMGLFGLRLFDRVYFGYSYDVSINIFRSYNNATHEIMIGGNIFNKKQNMPRYF